MTLEELNHFIWGMDLSIQNLSDFFEDNIDLHIELVETGSVTIEIAGKKFEVAITINEVIGG